MTKKHHKQRPYSTRQICQKHEDDDQRGRRPGSRHHNYHSYTSGPSTQQWSGCRVRALRNANANTATDVRTTQHVSPTNAKPTPNKYSLLRRYAIHCQLLVVDCDSFVVQQQVELDVLSDPRICPRKFQRGVLHLFVRVAGVFRA